MIPRLAQEVTPMRSTLLLAFVLTLMVAGSATAGAPLSYTIALDPHASGFSQIVAIANAGDGTNRLFACEQEGQILVIQANGTVNVVPFLDIDPVVGSVFSEQGLLGLAFHPDYGANGRFFVYYTDNSGDTVIEEYHVSGDPDVASATPVQTIITADQPASNHNGGQIAFGPDGYLYIGLGDGGSGGDPWGNSRNLGSLLGSILRIDVDGDDFPVDPERNYRIPPDNPWPTGRGANAPEIWAYGLRNPWRFSFDRKYGDLFIADVGQSAWEEVNLQPAGTPGGRDFGWDCAEGAHEYVPPQGTDGPTAGCSSNPADYELPILEYSHGGRCSITGGYRYYGALYPDMQGLYLFGDYCSGDIMGGSEVGSSWSLDIQLYNGSFGLYTFGEDENGEVYVSYGSAIYRIIDSTPQVTVFIDDFDTGDTAWWSAISP
jgi:glucose/arabinose dehydrogenase